MEATATTATTTNHHYRPLHTIRVPVARTILNRAYALVYACAILVLLYYHTLNVLRCSATSLTSFAISVLLFVSDVILAFMWATSQCFRLRPILRHVFPENLNCCEAGDFLAMDVFICTADPYKEPPLRVVNTALSVMGYEYPTEKLSVYISDDGGSMLTLFAVMEGAKFARHWLPFCKKHYLTDRCPEAYFENNRTWSSEISEIKVMYDDMKTRIGQVMSKNKVPREYIKGEDDQKALNKFADKNFTRQDHPTVIQVLLDSNGSARDTAGQHMPNLVYVSRQKSSTSPHNFKAGALNTLLRVSATMTNASVILTLDCDMYSNDPQTLQCALCYFSDSTLRSSLGYVQFPQRFHGINEHDIYGCHYVRMFQIYPLGIDGLQGPDYIGTGCFFARRALFGCPSSFVSPEEVELSPHHIVCKPIKDPQILLFAHRVASCKFELKSNWGSKMGFRYGSLVEDTNTGYQLHCEGWRSIFCNPDRPAFLGQAPINLRDVLIQTKRWAVGLLQMGFSKFSPLTFGVNSMGLLMGLCYSHYAFWSIWSIPITTYALVPQLALLNGLAIFPKVSDPWFCLYVFLFVGSYTQDYLEFKFASKSTTTTRQWWNDQRMWLIRGLTSFSSSSIHFLFKNSKKLDFALTNKSTSDENESIERYQQHLFKFNTGTDSECTMYVPMVTATIINLVAFIYLVTGFVVVGKRCFGDLFVQVFLVSFAVANCLPVTKAMFLRSDEGKIPRKITAFSSYVSLAIYIVFSLLIHGFDFL